MIRFEFADKTTLEALNDRADRLGIVGRPFRMDMPIAEYLLALGGITEATLRELEKAKAALPVDI